MAITDLLDIRTRKHVAWYGVDPPPDGEAAFKERGFAVSKCTDANLSNISFLSGLAGVIFVQSQSKPLQIQDDLQQQAQKLLDYGCLLIIRPTTAESTQRLGTLANVFDNLRLPNAGLPPETAQRLKAWQRGDDLFLPHAQLFDAGVTWATVANFVIEHPAGKAPDTNVQISPYKINPKLQPSADLLLRRAFWDCLTLELTPMAEGRSGAAVFRAYAELATGGTPLPYFVKITDRATILREFQNYKEVVDPYIPFHLGPHLVQERCCLGMSYGVIVGDFVEEAESLIRCASEGRATAAIACLFDRTLLGWHRAKTLDPRALCEILKFEFPRKINSLRFARAQVFGAKQTIKQLRSLFELCTSHPVQVGPIHGDLHAANVCIRADDAIVIDFCAHRSAPLIYDAACLEASLLVDGFRSIKLKDIAKWLQAIMPLYDCRFSQNIPPHANPKDKFGWFQSSVRQIRIYAREMATNPDQYPAALAVALLVKASKDVNAPEPEASRRAAAYVLAESLLSKTFGAQATNVIPTISASQVLPVVAPIAQPLQRQ